MNIQCPNPECRADNPASAKFCRKCGTAFSTANRFKQMVKSFFYKIFTISNSSNTGMFTLDTFRNISFQPVSVVKNRFVNRFVVFLCVLFAALWFATIAGITREVLYEIDHWFYEDVFMYHQYEVELGCLAIAGLCALFILKSLIKKLRYKLNADYIEESFVNNEIVRIARKSRMGLFDKSKNKVLLSSAYSNIEKFDNQHLLISKGNKKGLYSLTYRRIIIPVLYDSISQFANSVTSVTTQGLEHHYDVKGNELR
ncbi:zinc ribbon domain-containing protein [Parabacteroides pacaensis]|uniref:zinc ribbon domain-containing protein n=1 Tax=Parabacteroides pacaensis TaxID=2086575 RepID=UPI000D103479|nr:zinc ribbon domain-containing protein [Parabacteroides pacaensis]